MQNLLDKLNSSEFGDLGTVVEAGRGRWIIGNDDQFPVQIEQLATEKNYLLYATAIRSTAEPVFVSMMKTLFIENLKGLSLGRYGICFGPVTITLYQHLKVEFETPPEKLAATLTCHRMLMECYLDGDAALDEDQITSRLTFAREELLLPFRH